VRVDLGCSANAHAEPQPTLLRANGGRSKRDCKKIGSGAEEVVPAVS
jgi:hypothetical protein